MEETLEQARSLLKGKGNVVALRAIVRVFITLTSLIVNRLGLNSRNSSKPPSMDPHRKRKKRKEESRKPGGQAGQAGRNLELIDDPDQVEMIEVDPAVLPADGEFQDIGYERRQVFDIQIKRVVTEYRAQIMTDEQGRKVVATFPPHVKVQAQYGPGIKSLAVYLSNSQLLPYKRIEELYADQFNIPLNQGSVYNFNVELYKKLARFGEWMLHTLPTQAVLHVDDTGINISGKRKWMHVCCNESLTWLLPHPRRGFEAMEAMEAMGVLLAYSGYLVHDHWKPYYRLTDCTHVLCNAHHLRELECAWEQDHQQWAETTQNLLLEINREVEARGGPLSPPQADAYRQRYREVLEQAETECPAPDESQRKPGQRGRLKRTKARNLLERLGRCEEDTLRFMVEKNAPFTNNCAEIAFRMLKVHQKVSGCFRSEKGALMHALIRSYLSTCSKQKLTSTKALGLVFNDQWPAFMTDPP